MVGLDMFTTDIEDLTRDVDQCERLAQHIEEYIQGCKEEELYRQASIAPTVEEYWAYRLKSSAVCVTLAMQEWVPPYIFSGILIADMARDMPSLTCDSPQRP